MFIKNLSKFLSRGLIKQSALYSIFNILNSAIPFVLIPFLSRALLPEEYGIITLYTTAVNFLLPFIGLNLQGFITNKFYSKDEKNIPNYIGNAIFILLISTSFGILILSGLSGIIESNIQFPSEWLWAVVLVCGIQTIIQICLVNWQVQGKVVNYGIFQISFSLLNFLLTLFFIYQLNWKWEARIIANTLISLTWGMGAIYILNTEKKIVFIPQKRSILEALNFGGPLIAHSIGGFLIAMTDKIVIAKIIGIEATGIYGIGFQVGSVLSILTNAFNLAYVPWLYSKLRENKTKEKVKIVRLTYRYFLILILFVIAFVLVLPLFSNIFLGEKFLNSYAITIWILVAFAFNGMYLMVTNYIFFAEKTHLLGITTLFVGILNVFLCIFLVNKLGIIGGAIATATSYFLCFIITWILSNIAYPMPWFKKQE